MYLFEYHRTSIKVKPDKSKYANSQKKEERFEGEKMSAESVFNRVVSDTSSGIHIYLIKFYVTIQVELLFSCI